MNEIEQMYRNAEIVPLCQIPDQFCGMQNIYEDFTAEKQLEVIKMLLELDYFGSLTIFNIFGEWRLESSIRSKEKFECFEDALAHFVNKYWKVLTEDEKQKIREILE